jgi:muramoyltetrapeptide carboxypeptidase
MTKKLPSIGIFAPSSRITPEKFEAGLAVLKNRYDVFVHPQTYAEQNQSAGTTEGKIAAYHDLLNDPNVDVIIAAAGGNRATHMLDAIDWELVRTHPKPVMGFSDTTALLCGIAAKTGIGSIFGPVVQSFSFLSPEDKDRAFTAIEGRPYDFPGTGDVLAPGTARGPLLGGTLSVLVSLIGTSYFPNMSGGILFLEDTGEETSRIDRMILQLRRVIPFSSLQGIIFGEFSGIQDTGRPFGFTLKDILQEHTNGLDIPVVMNAPFGHGPRLAPLPFGKKAHMICAAGCDTFDLLISP